MPTYLSKVIYSGNGVITDFDIPFPYLEKDDITAKVAGNSVAFTWINDAKIKILPAPVAGTSNLVIYRTTDVAEPEINFTDGSTLTELDLDTNAKQAVYLIQELQDQIADILVTLSTIQTVAGNLPTVTGADNGKILKVVSGAWQVVAPASITVVTDSIVDSGLFKLQKKTRANVKVVDTDAESAATDFHTGTGC